LMTYFQTQNKVNDLALCEFLSETRFSKASEAKDKILALYALLTNSGVPLPLRTTGMTQRTSTVEPQLQSSRQQAPSGYWNRWMAWTPR
jgi:hypothetical protein